MPIALVLSLLSLLLYSTGNGIVKDVTVVETNYTEYAIVLKYKVFNRDYTQVALYSKTRILHFGHQK